MYVAGFIGSPRMNFIPVTCRGAEATASGFALQLPQTATVEHGILGIRPENLTDDHREGSAQVNMRVDVVEVLGPDQYLYGKIGEDEVTARVDPHFAAVAGDLVPLTINLPRIHLFDATTELTLI